jgi:hypothetical protein
MKKIWLFAALAVAITATGCTDEGNTVATLEAAGFTDIEAGGYAFWGCGKDDTYATKFTAKNPLGNTVSGVVCCGGWGGKGCTIRF